MALKKEQPILSRFLHEHASIANKPIDERLYDLARILATCVTREVAETLASDRIGLPQSSMCIDFIIMRVRNENFESKIRSQPSYCAITDQGISCGSTSCHQAWSRMPSWKGRQRRIRTSGGRLRPGMRDSMGLSCLACVPLGILLHA